MGADLTDDLGIEWFSYVYCVSLVSIVLTTGSGVSSFPRGCKVSLEDAKCIARRRCAGGGTLQRGGSGDSGVGQAGLVSYGS